jgi:primosomal protein N'
MLNDAWFSYKPGDVIADGDALFCVLGQEVCFAEQYRTMYRPYQWFSLIEKSFFWSYQLALLHHIVQTYYTTYKAVMRLLLPGMDISALLTYKKTNKKSQYQAAIFDEKTRLFVPSTDKYDGQQLILVPDLRTADNLFDEGIIDASTLRHSGLTQLQMTKIFRWAKQGQISTLMTTFAGIFHDRKNLQRILFIQPHKRYYQHQQDPRYKVAEVIDFIAAQTGAELVKWG